MNFQQKTSSGWKWMRLQDVSTFQNGHAFYKDGYSDTGLIAIDLLNVNEEGQLRLSPRDKHVSLDLCQKYSRFILNKEDIVIVMTDMTQRMGILGKCAIIDRDNTYILNQRMGRIVSNNEIILTKYLYYFINSSYFLEPLYLKAKGAVQKYVNIGDITENMVLVPPLPIQHRIVDILAAYDDLIENNTRRIAILEEMARSLYREWFVNFRFPGNETVKMVDSPLGLIPEGWEIKPFSQAIMINPQIETSKSQEYMYVDMSGLSTNSMIIECKEKRLYTNGSKFINGEHLGCPYYTLSRKWEDWLCKLFRAW